MSTRLEWDTGDLCEVVLNGKKYPGKVLEWAFSPNGDYLQIRLEYYVEYQDWEGNTHLKTLLWREPIQSYKLRRRYTLLPGEQRQAKKPRRNRVAENDVALPQIARRVETK